MGKSHGISSSRWQKPKKYRRGNPWPADPTIGRENMAVNCNLTRESGLRGGNSGPSFRVFSSEGKIFINLWFRKAESHVWWITQPAWVPERYRYTFSEIGEWLGT